MLRNRDVGLHNFFPLVHPQSLGQSVSTTDLNPVPSDVPRPRILCINYDIIYCSYHKSSWLGGQLVFLDRLSYI
jgi:hypothetical protein